MKNQEVSANVVVKIDPFRKYGFHSQDVIRLGNGALIIFDEAGCPYNNEWKRQNDEK